jgi:sulfopyruvate decarboxylase subunit beta
MGRMTLLEALTPIAKNRDKESVVITTMSSVGVWPSLSDSPQDFHYLPSSMGQAVPLGLGLSLSKKGLRVIVVSGDGGLLMNLGCLVTLACHQVPVCVVLIDNGLYEVTGGQDIAGAGKTDYAALAKASGIDMVQTFDSASQWNQECKAVLNHASPSFAWCKVAGKRGQQTPKAPRPMSEQIQRLRESIMS